MSIEQPPLTDIKSVLEEDIKEHEVSIRGSVDTVRKQKKISFIRVSDGSHAKGIQIIVFNKNLIPDRIGIHSSVVITGTCHASNGKTNENEIHATSITLIGNHDRFDPATYLLAKKKQSLDMLRKEPALRIRTKTFRAIQTIRNCLTMALHEFYQNKNFQCVHTPLITGSDCEGGGDTFSVVAGSDKIGDTFFKKPAFLTVSGQLHLETYAACGLGKGVYTFGPTFRSEHSNTSRHLSEFWMVEPEIAWCSFEELLQNAEDSIAYCAASVIKKCTDELDILWDLQHKADADPENGDGNQLLERIRQFSSQKPTRITYSQAVAELKDDGFEVQWGDDLSSDMEKHLTKKYKGIVTTTHYPKSLKSFYMKDVRDENYKDAQVVECMDILVPGVGELVGGSMREASRERLLEKMKEKNMTIEGYEWYLDIRDHSGVQTGGYGIGFERIVQLMTGMKNIRDVIPYFRAYGSELIH